MEKWLVQQAGRSSNTMFTCAGWCNVINPIFWNGENTAVTAREVWGVCLPLSRAHFPYRVPHRPQKPSMTLSAPCAAKAHVLLSVTSLIYKFFCYIPYFTRSMLHSQSVLPRLFSGFALRAANLRRCFPYSRQSTTRTECGKQRKESCGSRKWLWGGKGKFLFLSGCQKKSTWSIVKSLSYKAKQQ